MACPATRRVPARSMLLGQDSMSSDGTHDSRATPAKVRLRDGTSVTEPPSSRGSPPVDGHDTPRIDTPLLPASLPHQTTARATLTVLTGRNAGQLVAVDGNHVTIGRGDDADLVVDDPGVSRHHARIGRQPGGGFYVEDLGSTNGTFVGGARVGVSLLHQVDVLQLGPSLKVRFAMVDPAEESLSRYLYEAAIHDPLTHAYNRQYLADRMVAEIARARRAGSDVAVLMIDVDALKTVNDRFGHLAGDRVLSTIASRIQHALRVCECGGRLLLQRLASVHAEEQSRHVGRTQRRLHPEPRLHVSCERRSRAGRSQALERRLILHVNVTAHRSRRGRRQRYQDLSGPITTKRWGLRPRCRRVRETVAAARIRERRDIRARRTRCEP